MPGIAGILSTRPAHECTALVSTMVRAMLHEPFCTAGTYAVPEMGLFAGWVAHEGSFAADQVSRNERDDVALLFSGECFGEVDRRQQLIRAGHHLGAAPAAWLVHDYEDKGEKFFADLNGLLSGLLIDKRLGRAFLFTDRYGIERIYWCESNGDLYFASEAKALLQTVPEVRQFDPEGVAEFLAFGCMLESRTLFRGIHAMPGGSRWTLEKGRWRSGQYFNPSTWEEQQPLTANAFEALLDDTFTSVLPSYFEPEATVGLALSGGLDTRMILACRPDAARHSISYTYAGTQGNTRDVNIAATIAQLCGLEHRVLRVGADFLTDFSSYADKTVYVTDGCLGVTGAHELYLSAQARRVAPVRLTGVFGGEILRGVPTIKPLSLSPDLLEPALRNSVARATIQGAHDGHPVGNAAFRNGPAALFGSLAACRSQVTFRTPFLNNRMVSLACRAPASLRASHQTGAGLVRRHDSSLARVPTDRRSLQAGFGLKQLLRRLEGDVTFRLEYLFNEGLPARLSPFDRALEAAQTRVSMLGQHKYLRYRGWFRRELAGYIADRLDAAKRSTFWNQRRVGLLAQEHISGRRNNISEINAVLTLEAVDRLLVGASAPCGTDLFSTPSPTDSSARRQHVESGQGTR